MHADFSVELGHDDPVLEIPWASDDPTVRYYDLKTSPELVLQIPEAAAYPEIRTFLTRINVPGSPFATAKCDVWQSREISPEEEIFGADRKFVSYVDLVFVDETARSSFEKHEEFAKNLCALLSRSPDIAATIELVIRRCYYHQQPDRQDESDRISSDRISSDRISKDAQQARPDCQVIPLRQKTSSSHESNQYPRERPQLPADYIEASTRLGALGKLDSDESVKPATPDDPGASLKPERLEGSSASLSPQDPISVNRHDPGRMDQLHTANIFPSDPKAFSNESTGLLYEPDAVVTGLSLTAYVTGFGDGDNAPRPRWAIAISLLQHALVQVGHI